MKGAIPFNHAFRKAVIVSIRAPVKGAIGVVGSNGATYRVSIRAPVKGAIRLEWGVLGAGHRGFNPRPREGSDPRSVW